MTPSPESVTIPERKGSKNLSFEYALPKVNYKRNFTCGSATGLAYRESTA